MALLIRLYVHIIICFFISLPCITQGQITKNNASMPYFDLTTLKNYPTFLQHHDPQHPLNPQLLQYLTEQKEDLYFILFLGTWCIDSKRIVPVFTTYLQQAGIPLAQVLTLDLDQNKQAAGTPLPQIFHIRRLPTLIVYKKGQETARIIEYGADHGSINSWERALLSAIKK